MIAAPSVKLENLTLSYRRHPAVHHLSGEFGSGSLTAIVGPNGAGKSTLLKAIMRMHRVDAGSIDLGASKRSDIAYLPQLNEVDRAIPVSVLDFVSLGAWHQTGAFGRVSARLRHKLINAIAAVELTGMETRLLSTLSGGQFQRALFARLLVQDAKLILLDEPFAAIDARTTGDLTALIRNWHTEGRTVVAVLHDIDLVRRHFPMTLLLAGRKIGWGPTSEILTDENLTVARQLSIQRDEPAIVCDEIAA